MSLEADIRQQAETLLATLAYHKLDRDPRLEEACAMLRAVLPHCGVGALCGKNPHAKRADCVRMCARCKPE